MRREGDCVYDQVAAFATRRGKVNIHHRPLFGYQWTSTGSRVPLDDIPCWTMEVAVSDFRGVREGDLVPCGDKPVHVLQWRRRGDVKAHCNPPIHTPPDVRAQ